MKTYLSVYFGTVLVAMFLVPIVSRLAKRYRLVDFSSPRKPYKTPIPRIGGIVFVVSTLALVLPVFFLDNEMGQSFHEARTEFIVLLVGAVFIFIVGLIDDLRSVRGYIKLLCLIAASLAICASGATMRSISVGTWFVLETGWAAWPLTIFWILMITVCLSVIDGLDGLAAGIAAIVCGSIVLPALWTGQGAMAVLMLALLGSVTGFLFFNFYPAKIFMGDGGSLFLGFMIGAGSVVCRTEIYTLAGLVLPLLVLGVLFLYTVFVGNRRRILEWRLDGKFPTPEQEEKDEAVEQPAYTDRPAHIPIPLNIMGIPVVPFESYDQVLKCVERIIESDRKSWWVAINPVNIYQAWHKPELLNILRQADVGFCDGVGVSIASKILHGRSIKRYTGCDLFFKLLSLASRKEWGVYLLGASAQSNVAARLELLKMYPDLRIVGWQDGYFEDSHTVIEQINSSGADLLFVAMGSPKQEQWICRHRHAIDVNFCMGVGGSFDIAPARLRRAPKVFCMAGTEFLFRLIREPRKRWPNQEVLFPYFLRVIEEKLFGSMIPATCGIPWLDSVAESSQGIPESAVSTQTELTSACLTFDESIPDSKIEEFLADVDEAVEAAIASSPPFDDGGVD